MTQSIITRYHGATNLRAARYSATTSGGKRIYRAAQYSLNGDENQKHAANDLAKALGWGGFWQGGALDDKGAMVWVNTSDSFAHHYRFEVTK